MRAFAQVRNATMDQVRMGLAHYGCVYTLLANEGAFYWDNHEMLWRPTRFVGGKGRALEDIPSEMLFTAQYQRLV